MFQSVFLSFLKLFHSLFLFKVVFLFACLILFVFWIISFVLWGCPLWRAPELIRNLSFDLLWQIRPPQPLSAATARSALRVWALFWSPSVSPLREEKSEAGRVSLSDLVFQHHWNGDRLDLLMCSASQTGSFDIDRMLWNQTGRNCKVQKLRNTSNHRTSIGNNFETLQRNISWLHLAMRHEVGYWAIVWCTGVPKLLDSEIAVHFKSRCHGICPCPVSFTLPESFARSGVRSNQQESVS